MEGPYGGPVGSLGASLEVHGEALGGPVGSLGESLEVQGGGLKGSSRVSVLRGPSVTGPRGSKKGLQ